MACDTSKRLGFIDSTLWKERYEQLRVTCKADFTDATVIGLKQGSVSESVKLASDITIPISTPTTVANWSVLPKGAHVDSNFSLATGNFTAPEDGIYHISGSVSWKDFSAGATRPTGKRNVRIKVTDFASAITTTFKEVITQPAASKYINTVQTFTTTMDLDENDIIFIEIEHDSDTTVDINTEGTNLCIWRIR